MKYGSLLFAVLALALSSAGTIAASPQFVVSKSNPSISLRIASSFVQVPPLSFPLKYTDVVRRIFVETDRSKIVRRLVVIQFEKVRKGSDFKFVYRPKPPIVFGKETYRFGAYVYDDLKAAASAPGMEASRTRAALEMRGYHLPRLLRTVRLARVVDSHGQSEIIIFYNENADSAYPTGDLPNTDDDGDLVLDRAHADSLFDRLKSVIQPIGG